MKMAEVTVVKEMKKLYWCYFLYLLVSTVNSAMFILQLVDAYIGIAQGGGGGGGRGGKDPPLFFLGGEDPPPFWV